MRLAILAGGPLIKDLKLSSRALGGSETALVQVSQALARAGARVEVFANLAENESRLGEVTFRGLDQWVDEAGYEVVLVSRFFDLLDRVRVRPGRIRGLWMHDVLDRPESAAPRLQGLDFIFCLSEFHLADTARRLPGAGPELIRTVNGLDLELIRSVRAEAGPRSGNRLVYASRPERGLWELLTKIWPRLKADRPELELTLCGYEVDQSGFGPELRALYGRIREMTESSPGITPLGGLPKREYYRLLAESGFLLYPCTFAEISCLVALEAQALGLPLLTSDRFALSETVKEARFKVSGRPGSTRYVESFINDFNSLKADYGSTLELAAKAGERVFKEHDWDLVAQTWMAHFQRFLDRSETQETVSNPEDQDLNRPQVRITEGPKGGPLLKAREGEGAWTALHSAYDPETEARRMVAGLDLESAGLVVILGHGMGYHVEQVLAGLQPSARVVLMEPSAEVLRVAGRAGPLEFLDRVELVTDPDPERAMTELARFQLAWGFPETAYLIHRASVRAMPRTYGLLAEKLASASQVGIGNRLRYPKFDRSETRILILHGKYFLMGELKNALGRLGVDHRLIIFRDEGLAAGEVIAKLINEIAEFKPDFVLTVNHLGFDRDGVLTDFFGRIRMPFASWYVDSPLLIIRHYQENRSPLGTIFLWDSDYLAELQELGYEHLHYLPLGTDETNFRPMSEAELVGRERFRVAFVANSMAVSIRKRVASLNLPEQLWPKIRQAARLFTADPSYSFKTSLGDSGLMKEPFVNGLGESGVVDLEALILWVATQTYRYNAIRPLAPLGVTIAGDDGWEDLVEPGVFQLHQPLNYYDQLPSFYNRTTINFNATSLQMKTGINQRVFDVPACGGFLLSDQRDQQDALFEPGREAVSYSSPEEAHDLAEYYLGHPEERRRIAEAAHAKTLDQHTYHHRLAEMIRVMRRNYRAMTWEGSQV